MGYTEENKLKIESIFLRLHFFFAHYIIFALLAYFAVISSIFPSIQILITLVFFSWLLGSTFKIAKLGCSVCVLSRMAPSLSVDN